MYAVENNTAKLFWDNVQKELDSQNTTFEWLYIATKISKGTFSSWKTRNILPRIDEALKISHALNTTIEHLVNQDDFSGYEKIEYEKYKNVIEKLKTLDEISLAAAQKMISGLTIK